jgi:hypothetical protein
MYKTNFKRNQTNGVLTAGSKIWCFFLYNLFRQRTNRLSQKMAMPRGNLQDILFGLGLWYSFCTKRTHQRCLKSNLQQNRTNGCWTIGFRIWCSFTKIHALNIEKEQNACPKNDHAMRKSHGLIVRVRALVLIWYKKDNPKVYKIEFATESH